MSVCGMLVEPVSITVTSAGMLKRFARFSKRGHDGRSYVDVTMFWKLSPLLKTLEDACVCLMMRLVLERSAKVHNARE